MKRTIALLIAFCMILGLAGCNAGQTVPADTQADTRVLHHLHNTVLYMTLDPSTEYSNGIIVLQNVYETLVRYNPETKGLDPLLATSWSHNKDGTVWVFHLRSDVTFHDGTKMTSAQVVNSITRTMALGQGGAYIWDALSEESGGKIEATGDYEVTFTCGYPCAIDLAASAGYGAYIMSDKAAKQDAKWFDEGNDGGTGPYQIAQATGDTVSLQAYEGYRGGWTDAQCKNIVIRKSTDSGDRREMLESGECQLACDLSFSDLEILKEQTDKVYIYRAETFNNVIMFLNTQVVPCDNADFRRAMAWAFPYADTVNDILKGNARQSVGMVPAGLWGHNEGGPQYSCDMEQAKEYLKKSGVDTNGLKLTVTYMTGEDSYTGALELFRENLQQLGIELELKDMEWDQQWEQAQNADPDARQDMFVFIWWPDYADPASWFTSLLHSEDEIVYNLSYLDDDSLDRLIDEAVSETAANRPGAMAKYVEAQKLVAEEAYVLNLYDQVHTYVVSSSIEGVRENPSYSYSIPYYQITWKE